MTRSERGLTALLRFGGVLTGSALLAVFLPAETMASIHRALGLGALPEAPITDYLTRSLSAMYAFHGLVLLALSANVRRHLSVVHWVGWGTLALGALMIGIDLQAGMPMWWTLGEGPIVIVIGVAVLALGRAVREERGTRTFEGRIPLKKARS